MKREDAKSQGVPEELLAEAERIGGESAVIRQLLANYTPRRETEHKQRRTLALIAVMFLAGVFVLGLVLQSRTFAQQIEKERIATGTSNCERLNEYGQIIASVLVDARSRMPEPDPDDPEAVARYKAAQEFYEFNTRKFAPRDCSQVVGRAEATAHKSMKETA